MDNQQKAGETATLSPAKVGNNHVLDVNGRWYYASKEEILAMAKNGRSCVFRVNKNGLRIPGPDKK